MKNKEIDTCICKDCGREDSRLLSGFFPGGRNKRFVNLDGAQWVGRKCPVCVRDKSKVHNRKVRSSQYFRSIKQNIISDCEYNKNYYIKNKDILKEKRKSKYYKVREQSAKRRARQRSATPRWLTSDHKNQIISIYKECPKGFHVDHIIPLNGRIVSGLHVPWNLQYLPASDNIKKGNRI